MKLLEYEAKSILRKYAVPVPDSLLITRRYIPDLSLPVVLKSQVPIGGRGKLGGVITVTNATEVTTSIDQLFTRTIKGFLPIKILAEQLISIKDEYYLLLVIDRDEAVIKLVAHTNGGVEVELNDPSSFLSVTLTGENSNIVGEQLAEYYDLPGQTFALQDMVEQLYSCFVKNDATLIEINPLMYTTSNTLVAGDCKMELDDAAAFRHSNWEFEDKPINANFVELDRQGTVATIANGAGLAMATVDAVQAAGMTPANFLDIGGGADIKSVTTAFENIMEFPNIQVIVINIFAGITRCDEVAHAIIAAKQKIANFPPLFIRLAGTGFEEAVSLLSKEAIPTLATLEECIVAAKEANRG